MTIDLTCTNCQAVLRVAQDHAGKKVRCPNCNSLTRIPGESTPAFPAPTSQGVPQPPPGQAFQAGAEAEPGAPGQPGPAPGFQTPIQPGGYQQPAQPGQYHPPGGHQQPGFPPQQAVPPYHGGGYYRPEEPDSLGIASVILGSISLLFSLGCPCLSPVLIIPGLICGFNSSGTMRMPGLIINFLSIGLCVIRMAIMFFFISIA